MCVAQEWKSTGEKKRLVKRIVKKQMALLQGKEGVVSLIESKIGPTLGTDGPAGRIRSFYATHFQALDRFDRVWYEMRFHVRPRHWISHFSWSLLHAAVINARAAWCGIHQRRVSIKEFLAALVSSYVLTVTP
jgi:hypothetical protein